MRLFTSTVIDYVNEGKLHDIELLMQRSNQPNLVTMNMSLFDLYQRGIISENTALEYSLEKVEMNQLLKGMQKGIAVEENII